MIRLRVNGKPVELDAPTPLLDYLAGLGVDPGAVAVEVSGEIVQRDAYPGCTLGEGDEVEIVRMVGGGRLAAAPVRAVQGSSARWEQPPSTGSRRGCRGVTADPSAPAVRVELS